MMIKRKLSKLATFFQSAMVILIASLFVVSVVYAATTIGSNITTGGTLNVTGLTTLVRSTSTSATTSAYLMVGYEFTIPTGFDYSEDLAVSGNTLMNGVATATTALWVGTGNPNYLDLTGGDLYVQDTLEVDGDARIGGFASTTGDVIVGGGTIDVTGQAPTTTAGIFSRRLTTATSTISIGNTEDSISSLGCLELVTKDGDYITIKSNDAKTDIIVELGRCNP